MSMSNEEPRFLSFFDKRFARSHWFLICAENVGGWKFSVGLAHDWGVAVYDKRISKRSFRKHLSKLSALLQVG